MNAITADSGAFYQVYRSSKYAGPFKSESVMETPSPIPVPLLTFVYPAELHFGLLEVSETKKVGSYGLRYVKSVWEKGDTAEGRFWKLVTRFQTGETSLVDSLHRHPRLRKFIHASSWFSPVWIKESKKPGQGANKSRLAAICVVQSSRHTHRAVAFWSLYMAHMAGRLRRCRRCGDLFLADRRSGTWCGCPKLPPGRPHSIPQSCAESRRRFQNRIYQWRTRKVISDETCRRLLLEMNTDLGAVRTQRLSSKKFEQMWTKKLADLNERAVN